MRTMLVRILQQLEVGQDVLMIMSCTKSSHYAGGRDPKVVVEAVEASGFAVTYLDIMHLPYSFSMNGYGHAQIRSTTLVLRATRVAASDAARIFLSQRPEGEASGATSSRQGKQPFDKDATPDLDRLVLDACRTRVSAAHAFEICGSAMDASTFDTVIGRLAARQFIDMDVAM